MENSNNTMVSIIILCYRHFNYIFDAISSVLCQNYESIELIISDDGSADFPQEAISNYILQNKRTNIKHFFINHENQNCGTVKHLNKAIKMANGQYIIALAGDDRLYNRTVVQQYIDGFKKANDNVYIEMAQTAMYDRNLSELISYYLKPSVKSAIQKEHNEYELFNLLAYSPCLPSTSTCFKRTFFEKFGFFDEQYILIEDWPMHLRLAREGWKIHYENFIAIKHRDGGISHGGIGAFSKTKFQYYCDLLKIRENEIQPYLDLLSNEVKQAVEKQHKREKLWIESQFYKYTGEKKYLVNFIFSHPLYLCKKGLIFMHHHLYSPSRKLLAISLFLMIVTPMASSIFDYLGLFGTIINTKTMYTLALCAFIISLILLIPCLIGKVIEKIGDFPSSCLYIG